MQELILELPYPKRQILYLHYYMDMTFVEIAKIVELSEENVRQIAARSRQKLEKQLRERGITDGNEQNQSNCYEKQ
ncbi:MAG: sigma-70 family RNA polymerase sigma factor [Lachnospiraceae bacterium]